MYYVYILECADGTFYCGITNDLNKRLLAHNGQTKGGARYTRSRRPVKLLHSENFSKKSEALIREAEIKKMKRTTKKELIYSP